jgi:hypothetical protein
MLRFILGKACSTKPQSIGGSLSNDFLPLVVRASQEINEHQDDKQLELYQGCDVSDDWSYVNTLN